MLKWAKLTNEETGAVIAGIGDNDGFFSSNGFVKMDIEQAYDGSWYLIDKVPVRPIEELKEEKYSALWSNFKEYQTKRVDAEDLVLASMGSLAGKPKCTAVRDWVMNLWRRYYVIKDQIAAATDHKSIEVIDLSPDSCGEIPYSIRELNEEVKQ